MSYYSDLSGSFNIDRTTQVHLDEATLNALGIEPQEISGLTKGAQNKLQALKEDWLNFDITETNVSVYGYDVNHLTDVDTKEIVFKVLSIIRQDGCSATGKIERTGERDDDIVRFFIQDNEIADIQKAKIVWEEYDV